MKSVHALVCAVGVLAWSASALGTGFDAIGSNPLSTNGSFWLTSATNTDVGGDATTACGVGLIVVPAGQRVTEIEAVIGNAGRMADLLAEHGSLAAFVWRYEPAAASRPKQMTYEILRATTTSPESKALSRDLKLKGFRFVGPTTVYAFQQAMGLVNDHLEGCAFQALAERARAELERPR